MQRLHLVAGSLFLFVVACTAAVRDEPTTQAQSAVGGPDTGFTCAATNVAMPADLPDVSACINDESGGTGPSTGCNGWTKMGAYATTSDELRSSVSLGAQLYSISPDASTLCLYLYRGDRASTNGSLNGVHCYNKTTCDVCWWDGSTGAGKRPTADVLKHQAADGSDCSDCHRNGPLLPKLSLWEALNSTTKALHQVCAKAGGGTWSQAPASWPLRAPDPASVVAAPSGCAGGSCHAQGFASGGSYCQLVKHAFADDKGSMRGDGHTFVSRAVCEKFRTDMGCADEDIPCDSVDVADADPAPPPTPDAGTTPDDPDPPGDDGN